VLVVVSAVESSTGDGLDLIGLETEKPDFAIVLYFVELVQTEKCSEMIQRVCTQKQTARSHSSRIGTEGTIFVANSGNRKKLYNMFTQAQTSPLL